MHTTCYHRQQIVSWELGRGGGGVWNVGHKEIALADFSRTDCCTGAATTSMLFQPLHMSLLQARLSELRC